MQMKNCITTKNRQYALGSRGHVSFSHGQINFSFCCVIMSAIGLFSPLIIALIKCDSVKVLGYGNYTCLMIMQPRLNATYFSQFKKIMSPLYIYRWQSLSCQHLHSYRLGGLYKLQLNTGSCLRASDMQVVSMRIFPNSTSVLMTWADCKAIAHLIFFHVGDSQ